MKQPVQLPARLTAAHWLSALSLGALAAVPVACNGASSPEQSPGGAPSSTESGAVFIEDSNFGGESDSLEIVEVYWGRLVEVFGTDGAGGVVPMNENFVIGAGLISDADFTLDINLVTGAETLTIQRDVTTPEGMAQFASLLQTAEANRGPIFDNGPGGAGFFSMVPRNAALVVRFNDLLDASTITPANVRLLTGSPSVDVFEARVFADSNHGAVLDRGDGVERFFSTRVILDPAISEDDASGANPPLAVNGLGLPGSARTDVSNIELRLPSTISPSFGQTSLLRNLSGSALDVSVNGTADLDSPTDDVVRAFRSGGNTSVTADPFNGFLRDDLPPRLVGQLPASVNVLPLQDATDPNVFTLSEVTFNSTACARRPRVGDIIEQPGIFAEVIAPAAPPISGVARDIRVRLLDFPDSFAGPGDWANSGIGSATYLTSFDPIADAGLPECFMQFSPNAPNPADPNANLSVDTTVSLRFSEPMDPTSLTAFDSLTLTRIASAQSSGDFVIGEIGRSPDLRSFAFVPTMPLAHTAQQSESYFVTLGSGDMVPRDLAGNSLFGTLPRVSFSIDPSAETVRNGGRVTRFSDPDEDAPFGNAMGPLTEWTGQHFYDFQGEFIRPRPVSRFQGVADRSNAIISLMNAFPQGVQTPLSPFGCRLLHIYRYIDVGFSITDTTNYNLDVEGLNWVPANGQVTADFFPSYEIRLGHCRHAPDENIETPSLFPEFPNSGLTPAFDVQVLTPEVSPMQVVHPRDRGYQIEPGDAFTTPTGTLMLPWPINADPNNEDLLYTWRDTAIQGRGSRNNEGVDPRIVDAAGLQQQVVYGVDNVQTIGLPLLVEHRCFPAAADALGNNSLEIAFAVNSSRRPFFRTFSVGGFAAGNQIVEVDPDLETRANGGFNPAMSGAPTPGLDPNVYLGALDLVVRVSRSVSIWFSVVDPQGDTFEVPHFDRPIVEPAEEEQPSGTRVELAFRGALTITDLTNPLYGQDPRDSTIFLDSYGNHYPDEDFDLDMNPAAGQRNEDNANPTISFLNGNVWTSLDPDATENPIGIDGAQFYQVRASFIANTESSLTPSLSALALTWD